MTSFHTFTAVLGVGLAFLILYLIRRDHLHLSHGVFWISAAGAAGLLGIWPAIIDSLAHLFGIAYPPALLLLVAVVVLLIKALHADMVNTRIERQVKRLNQRIALLEAEFQARERNSPPV